MRRIGLAVVVAVSVSLAPFATEARPARKVWRVGILVSANPRSYEAFVDELRKLGYIDGSESSPGVSAALRERSTGAPQGTV
jgi:hypothetical protein